MIRGAIAAAVAVAVLLGAIDAAGAHPLEPSSLELVEHAPGVASARLHKPAAATLAPVWPPGCTAALTSRELDGDASVERFELACGGRSLAGAELAIDGLAAHDTIALVRVELAGGAVVREVLGPSRPGFTVPPATGWSDALIAYARLGVGHLLGGLDHVLFVLGLCFVVRGVRARVITLTAFTAGHSLTLGLAVVGLVRVPAGLVEVLIALTLIAVALQVIDPDPGAGERIGPRRPWLIAGGFGLLHGLGFAGALTGAGLDRGEIPLALAGFNLGIELGQLALVAAAALVAAIAGRLMRPAAALAPVTRGIAGYAIGALAAMWCLERGWAAISV